MNKLEQRKKTAHKGDFGRVFVIAGSKGYTGAAYLASMAAIRSGAGLVTLGVPETIYSILAKRHAEVMVKPFPSGKEGSFAYLATKPVSKFAANQDVLAIGPGLSQEAGTQKFVRKIVGAQGLAPLQMIIDADGLNALKGHLDLLDRKGASRSAPTVLITPHPGEFKRLFGGTLTDALEIRKDRALAVAKKRKIVVLLKGHRTIVADPSGKVYVNKTGNPGMATGGSGDVLTGIIAALVGQKIPLFDAACLGAYVHGLAGDYAARDLGEISMIAGDLLDYLPKAFQKM